MLITTSTTLRNNLADVIAQVSQSKQPMLVARRGKIGAAIISIDLLEDLLHLMDKKYVKSIRTAREEYERGEVLTHDQLFGDL